MKRFLALGFLAAAGCAGAPSSEREPAGVTPPAISVEAVVKNTDTNVKQNFAGSLRSDNQLVASRGKDVAEAMAKNRCFTVLLSTLNQAVKNERARANLPESHLGILSWKLKVEFREAAP